MSIVILKSYAYLAIPYFKEAFVIYQSLGDLDGMAAVKENRETFLELTGEWFELSPHKYLE